MKCPNCGASVEQGDRCQVCGTKIKAGKTGFFNPKVYLITLVVILLGFFTLRIIPSFTTSDSGDQTVENLAIADYQTIQTQLASVYGGLVAYDGSNYYMVESAGLNRYDSDLANPVNLSDQTINYLLVDDDYIYYCDEYFDLYRVDKQFSTTPEKLLNNIYYPLLVDNRIYYQDDADNESIYYLNLDSDEQVKLNDEPSYSLMVANGEVYYLDGEGSLKRVGEDTEPEVIVAGSVNSFVVADNEVYYSDNDGIFGVDLASEELTSIIANDAGGYAPYMMLNVYQGNLVFVSSQGIQRYDAGQLETLVRGISYSKYVVINDVVITIDADLNYTTYTDFDGTENQIDGAMEV